MVGDEAAALRRALDISYPLENGIIRNWDDMEHVWSYLFNDKMKINPADKKVLLTEAPLNPKENRKKMIEVMFEKYVRPTVLVTSITMETRGHAGISSGNKRLRSPYLLLAAHLPASFVAFNEGVSTVSTRAP